MIVVKIGGSVLSDKDKKYDFSKENLRAVAKELYQYWKESNTNNNYDKFILVIGAGSVGHSMAMDFALREKNDPMKNALCSSKYDKYFDSIREVLIEEGLPIASIRTSNLLYADNGKLEGGIKILKTIVKNGMIPMLSADFCPDTKKGITLASADDIAEFIARKTNAKRVIMVIDTDVHDSNGKTIKTISNTDILVNAKKKRFDISGGIKKKVRVLLRLSDHTESVIVNGLKPGELYKALKKERVGTIIPVKSKQFSDMRDGSVV